MSTWFALIFINIPCIYILSFQTSSQCGNLDVRLMLKPSETVKEIRTSFPIDLILYDSELSKDIDQLRASVSTINKDYKIQSIGM